MQHTNIFAIEAKDKNMEGNLEGKKMIITHWYQIVDDHIVHDAGGCLS